MPCSQQYKQVAKTSKHVVLCIFILQDAADLTSLLCSFQKIHLFMNLRVGSSIICIQLLFSLALEVTKTKCNSNIEYQLYFKVACFHQFCLSQLYYIEKINCVVIFDNIFSTYLCAQLCLTVIPLTIVPQAPLYMAYSRQVYQSRLSFPTLGDLPNLGIEPTSHAYPALVSRFFTTESPWKPNSVTK